MGKYLYCACIWILAGFGRSLDRFYTILDHLALADFRAISAISTHFVISTRPLSFRPDPCHFDPALVISTVGRNLKMLKPSTVTQPLTTTPTWPCLSNSAPATPTRPLSLQPGPVTPTRPCHSDLPLSFRPQGEISKYQSPHTVTQPFTTTPTSPCHSNPPPWHPDQREKSQIPAKKNLRRNLRSLPAVEMTAW